MSFEISDGLKEIERFPVGGLLFDPRNPRRGDQAAVAGSLEQFSQVLPVLIASKPDGLQVVGGNTTLAAAIDLGATEIAGVLAPSGLDEPGLQALALALNRTSDLATYDDVLLTEILGEIHEQEGPLFASIGYTDDDLAALRLLNAPVDEQDFLPEDEETQPRLDQLRPVVCPECGANFHPR